jgi:transposase InsO family protein
VYILTAIDLFTKYAEAVPLRNKEVVTVARALVDVIMCRVGIPAQLLSDNGKEFENNMMREICRLLEIDKLRTTAYKASTNGAVERLHRTMNSMLGKVVSQNQRDWDERLPSVMAAYRASRHESTGYSPNFLLFGRENRAPVDLLWGAPDDDETFSSYDEYVDRKVELMRESYRLAREHLGVSAERNKHYYDMRVRPKVYKTGMWVYYYTPRRYIGRSPKWQKMFTGPFLVIREVGPVNVVIQQSRRSQPFVVHVDKLKLCLADTPQSWLTDTHDRVGDDPDDGPAPAEFAELLELIDAEVANPDTCVDDDIQQSADPGDPEETVSERPRRVIRRPRRFDDFV